MTHALLPDQSDLIARHQANIAASLARRLDRARATQNAQLLALLEQEQQQLGQQVPTQSNLVAWGKALWHRLTEATNRSKLSIEPIVGDAVIWRAYDPRTRETRYAETEAELIDWIEGNVYSVSYEPIEFKHRSQFR